MVQMNISEQPIDSSTAPLSDITRALAELELQENQYEGAVEIAQIKVSMPLELDVHRMEDGQVQLAGTPPHILLDTGFDIPLHQITLTITRSNGEINE